MSDTRLDLEERCEKCAHFHRLKHNFKKGIGFEESTCCDVLLHLPDSTDDTKPWVQEVTRLGMCEMFTEVNGLPSATPQEPQRGHWIVEKGGSYLGQRNACCSNCKDFYTNDWNVMNYCPNCGADMREVKE